MKGAHGVPDVVAADSQTEAARATSEGARAAAAAARDRRSQAEAAEAKARTPLEEAEREVQRLSAEVKALGDLLHPEGEGLFPPLIDAVTVQAGYEAALAAALGDDLQAPLDEASPHHWRDLGALDASPAFAGGLQAAQRFREGATRSGPAPGHDGPGVPRSGRGPAETTEARPAPGIGARRSVALGRLCRFRRRPRPRRAAPVTAQPAHGAGAGTDSGARIEDRAVRGSWSAAKDAANAARDAAQAAEENERRTEQALIAAQDDATRAARAAAERASQLASLESEIRRLEQSIAAAEDPAPRK